MPVICPSILAANEDQYKEEMDKVVHLAHRVQIDLADGHFAAPQTIKPEQVWWPVGFKADIHLMYSKPLQALKAVLDHKPHIVIVHAESEGKFSEIVDFAQEHKIKLGLALLAETSPEKIVGQLHNVDHVLIFGGSLGKYGGNADMSQLYKAHFLKKIRSELEIGWDGGVNDQNVAELVNGGIDVLNVGGFIQNADDPQRAFGALQRIADETGTT